MKNKKHPDSSGNKSLKAMSSSCLAKFFHKTLSHFFKKFVFINLMLLTIACKKEKPTEYDTLAFDIQVEDVSCTEVWLKVKLGENLQPRNITLKRENTTIFTGEILNSDTTFIDENLLPKRSYKYTISKLNELGKEISRDVVATTMDTTSHNFTWQIDTLGDGASSGLYDVAIINDTLAYAVGEIYKRDSLGNWDPLPYNLVKWNGQRWELVKVTVQTRWGAVTAPIRGIFAFSAHDIWLVSGDAIHGDGRTWTNYDVRLLTGNDMVSVDKAWGSNSSNMYFVGWNGTIIHYDGARWRRLESGTTLGLTDIYGISKNEIYAVGLDWGSVRGIVIRYDGSKWNKLIDGIPEYDSELYGITRSVWIDEKGVLYTAGNFLYHYRFEKWRFVKSLNGNCFGCNPYYIYRGFLHSIRGNKSNDIFIFGEINTVRHFNGVSWSEVGLPYYPLKYDIFWYSCDVKGKLAIGVGKIGRRALAIIIKR